MTATARVIDFNKIKAARGTLAVAFSAEDRSVARTNRLVISCGSDNTLYATEYVSGDMFSSRQVSADAVASMIKTHEYFDIVGAEGVRVYASITLASKTQDLDSKEDLTVQMAKGGYEDTLKVREYIDVTKKDADGQDVVQQIVLRKFDARSAELPRLARTYNHIEIAYGEGVTFPIAAPAPKM